jgi:hypothetical protein
MGKGESIPEAVNEATRGAGTPSALKVFSDIGILLN